MDIIILGSISDVIGKIMIAYTAIQVHYRVWKEHRIDEKVFTEMKRERIVGIIGIVFILLGFFLQLPDKL